MNYLSWKEQVEGRNEEQTDSCFFNDRSGDHTAGVVSGDTGLLAEALHTRLAPEARDEYFAIGILGIIKPLNSKVKFINLDLSMEQEVLYLLSTQKNACFVHLT